MTTAMAARLTSVAWERRRLAKQLRSELLSLQPSLVVIRGVDQGDALEQALFAELHYGALRWVHDPQAPHVPRAMTPNPSLTRRTLLPTRVRLPASGKFLILARAPIHLTTIGLVAEALGRRGAPAPTVFADGFDPMDATPKASTVRRMDGFLASRSLRDAISGTMKLAVSTLRGWPASAPELARMRLRTTALRAVLRIAVHAARLESLVDMLQPALVATFDETGLWARILPAVAAQREVKTLGLPHAELTEPAAVIGAGYSAFAVYGPYSRATLESAGVESKRITEVGAPLFDSIALRAPDASGPDKPRRIVLASQYVVGAMTREVKARIADAGMAMAAAVKPAELAVVPHPLEGDAAVRETLSELAPRDGVTVRIGHDLHTELRGALALVTGWSNSVFEAAIAGVPGVTIKVSDDYPNVTYARDRIAIEADGTESAARLARELLDPHIRQIQTAAAREGIVAHIGEPDGHAADRCAELMISLL